MGSIEVNFLIILPAVGALITSFGITDSILYTPGSQGLLKITNDSGHAKTLPPKLHSLLLPLAAKCKEMGQYERHDGTTKFDQITRNVDLQGTGTGDTVKFQLYLFYSDPSDNVEDEQLRVLQKYSLWEEFVTMAGKLDTQGMLNDEERSKRLREYKLEYEDVVKEIYSQVIDKVFSSFDRDA